MGHHRRGPCSFLWLLIAGDLWKLYGFAVVFGFLWGGTGIIVTTLIGDTFGVGTLGTIMGMMNSGWSLGAAAVRSSADSSST